MATCATVYQVPGQKGSQGAAGTNGTDGENAYSTTTNGLTMPAAAGSTTVDLVNADWVVIGQFIEIESVGTFEVTNVAANTVTIKNPYTGTAGSYPNNVAPGTPIAATGLRVGPSGMQGTGGQGFQGVQGPQGTQGNQGFQGVSGGGGAQGFQGFQGFQGSSGAGANNGRYSFRARVSTTIANPGVPATVIFDTEEFDPDAAYNNGTGVYTAAATGVYQFNVKINSTTNSGTFWLQVNTVSIYQIGTLLYDFTGAVLLSLTATDTVRIWFSGSNVLGTNLGVSRSEFSGFLVR